MDESLRAQIDSNLSHLDVLIGRGRRICDSLAAILWTILSVSS